MKPVRGAVLFFAAILFFSLTSCGIGYRDQGINGEMSADQTAKASVLSEIEPICNLYDVYVESSVYFHSEKNRSYFFNTKNRAYMEAVIRFLENSKVDICDEYDTNDWFCINFSNASDEFVSMNINAKDQIKIDWLKDSKTYVSEGIYEALKTVLTPFIAESGKYYAIGDTPVLYRYEYAVYDTEHNEMESDTVERQPHIFVNNNIVHMYIQWGTGTLTRTGVFYDVITGQKSPEYFGVTDYFGSMVSSTESDRVRIYDMFSGNLLYTIDRFEKPLADSSENILSAYYTENGQLTVWYSDKDNNHQMQTFRLTTDLIDR